MGWDEAEELEGRMWLTKGGSTGSMRAYVVVVPDADVAVAAMHNAPSNVDFLANSIAGTLTDTEVSDSGDPSDSCKPAT